MSRWGLDRWILVPLLLLGWGLRLPAIVDNRFHSDEALYGYWGLLIGRGRDLWLTGVPVDKPPLLPYLVAGAQMLFGNSEFSVRLVGLAAGLLMIPLVALLVYSLYHNRWAAIIAATSMTLSPFAILFSATGFTDPLMVALGLATCVTAAQCRPGWAGLLAGLTVAAKQTGLAWLPLVAALLIASGGSQSASCGSRGSVWSLAIALWPFLVCFSLTMGLVSTWDMARVARGAEGFWHAGVTGYGGLRLIWPQELWGRLRDWIGLAGYVFVSPVVNGVLLAGTGLLVLIDIVPHRYRRDALTDLFFVSFVLLYSLVHWLWAFPVWDRYLLPLVPVLAVLLGRILCFPVSCLRSIFGRWSLVVGRLALCFCLFLPAFKAARSGYPIGTDHGAYDGIEDVSAFLCGLPAGTVVYQHWLGWHYAYYLFDAPLYLAYWPTPAWLAQDVQAFGMAEPRYLTFPSWESSARVERELAGVGYGLKRALTTARRDGTPSFTLYRIKALSQQ
jgi:4-amino-4-deoxy-L-arabinose transferase-like glycosyltransferase